MIIEVTGAPGAGKSTIVRQLINLSRVDDLHLFPAEEALRVVFRRLTHRITLPNSLYRPLWYSVMTLNTMVFLIEHLSMFRIVVSSQWARPVSWRLRLWILRFIMKKGGQYRLLHRYLQPNEAVIIDGGVVHFNVTLFTSEQDLPSVETLKRYVQSLPKSDLLIVVKVPPQLCVNRVNNRRQGLPSRMKGLAPELVPSFVKNQSVAVTAAVHEAQRCGWRVLVIDNTAPLAQVRNQLREHLKNRRSASLQAR